jgi:plastocyanin
MTSLTRRSFGRTLGRTLGATFAAALLLRSNRASAEEENVVHIDNFVFEPKEMKVKVGTTVTWQNRDDIPHNVVCAGKFRSKTMDTDDKFAFTFTAAGEYKYFCALHPHMTGVVRVE